MKYDPKIVVAWFAEHGIFAMPEHRFHPERKWRFDFAFGHGHKVALEVQGGVFSGGGHVRGGYIRKEHEKRNEAAAMGWRILYCFPEDLCMQETIDLIKRALKV